MNPQLSEISNAVLIETAAMRHDGAAQDAAIQAAQNTAHTAATNAQTALDDAAAAAVVAANAALAALAAQNSADSSVKTVNNTAPDANGNVNVAGGGDFRSATSAEITEITSKVWED